MISLGAALISVAGLAISAGYHDSHSGMTRTVARWFGAFSRRKKGTGSTRMQGQNQNGSLEEVKVDDPRTSLRSTLTVTPSMQRGRQHARGGQKAAEVSARVRVSVIFHSHSMESMLTMRNGGLVARPLRSLPRCIPGRIPILCLSDRCGGHCPSCLDIHGARLCGSALDDPFRKSARLRTLKLLCFEHWNLMTDC